MKSGLFLLRGMFAGCCFAFLSSSGAIPSFQQAPPTFRVEVDFVEVDVVVTDRDGNFVADLEPEDFELFEDGVWQQIATFRRVDLPAGDVRSTPEIQPIEPDVRTNAGSGEGRLYVLVLDDLHVAAERSGRVRRIAREFVERWVGPDDLVAVSTTSGRAEASQGFTDSRRRLLMAVEKFTGQKLRSATLEKIERDEETKGLGGISEFNVGDPLDSERGLNAKNALAHLRSVSGLLRNIHGRRKAVLYISEGIDYDIGDVFGARYAGTVVDEARAVIGEAGQQGVSVYSIDPRGLEPVGDELFEVGNAPSSFAERQRFPASDDPRYREQTGLRRDNALGVATLAAEHRLGRLSLEVLSAETGGFAITNQTDVEKGLIRVVEEVSRYYLLGYYPFNPEADGRFRPIEVRVKRPGLEVRARKGYIASAHEAAPGAPVLPEGASKALSSVIASPVPIPGLALRAFAAPLHIHPGGASVPVVVETAIQGFRFTEKDGKLHDQVEIWTVALDSGGRVVAHKNNRYGLTVSPEDRDRMLEDGFRCMAVLALPPGTYQLRVGAHENGAGLTGSVFYDLEIPEWEDSELHMSGLLIRSAREEWIPVASLEEERREVPLAPTTRRTFNQSDELLIYAEVYRSSAKPPPLDVEIEIAVRNLEGRVAYKSGELRKLEEPEDSPLILRDRLSLTGLMPGKYVLEVRARGKEDAPVERRMVFEVIEAPTVADSAPRRSDPVSDYLDLVAQYRSGHYGRAKSRLGNWTGDEARRVVGDLVEDSADATTLKVAVLLHTEIAILSEEALSSELRSEHFRIAKELVDGVVDRPEYHAFVRDWYLSLACFHHGGDLSLSEFFLKEAMRIVPEDAVLHLAMGSTYEVSSWLDQDRGRLGEAEASYRRALQFDPKMAEAHLRLGRVLDGRGGGKREDEARQELSWVATYSDDPYFLYLAHLFLGDLHLEREEYPAAIQSYRAAVSVAPQWQTAYLSLSQALQASGDRERASETLEQALEIPVSQPSYLDGFRLYRLGQMGKLPDLLQKMRDEVGR